MTKKRKDTAPRKLPSQQRSKDNVERILKAAATVLEEEGYDQLKTATIAQKAGASVGSVYQYFPNKHAILIQLVDRWLAGDNRALDEVESRAGSYETVVDEFVDLTDIMLRGYKQQKGLIALVTLCRNIPELKDKEDVHDRKYALRLSSIIERHGLNIDADESLALAGYFTIIVDAAAMSIATETEQRAALKTKFLKKSVQDLFLPYL